MLIKALLKARERFVAENRTEQYWQRDKMVYPENHEYASELAKHIERLTARKPEIRNNWKSQSDSGNKGSQEIYLDPCKRARMYLSAFEKNNAADEWSTFYGDLIRKTLSPVLDVLSSILTGRDTECFLDDITEMVNESQLTLKALFDEELDLYPDQYYIPCLIEYLYEWFCSSKQEAIEDFYMMFDFSLGLYQEECEQMYKRYVRQILCILEMIELTILSPEERKVVAGAL